MIFHTVLQAAVGDESRAAGAPAYKWSNVPLGANGFITGIVIHPTEPDLVYCRTDVGGCYKYDMEAERWLPLNDSFGQDLQSLYQIDGIALDASDPNRVYIAAGGQWETSDILRSDDRGKTWRRLNFTGGYFCGNGTYRGWGECIAVDPTDSNIVYCGTYNKGLWRSRNAGTTWEQVYATENPVRSVVFDKNGGRNDIYVGGHNEYLKYSADGGSTWETNNGSGVPADIKRMAVDSQGVLYIAGGNGVYKYRNGAAANISPVDTAGVYSGISVSAADDNDILCIGPQTDSNKMGVPFWQSKDGGETWINRRNSRRVDSTLSWDPAKDSTKEISSNAHCIVADPLRNGRVWIADWFCVSMTENINSEPYQKWNYLYRGIEEVCPRDFICPPTGEYDLIAAIADIDGVVYSDTSNYPTGRIRQNRDTPWMMGTSAIDYCKENPNIVFRVGIDYYGSAKAELSYDNTKTWQNITFRVKGDTGKTQDLWQFGQAAVSAKVNPETGYPSLVVIPSGRVPLVSLDGGYSWAKVSGITDTIISSQYWDKGIYLSSDGADGATFYIEDRNAMNGTNSSVYVSRDWGVTWEKTNVINGAWYQDKTFIKAAPGIAGDVWSCAGGRNMYHSTDYGKTWVQVSPLSETQCFGFGKAAPGQTYPTIYAYAKVSGVMGVHRSTDGGKSWLRINDSSDPIGRGPYVIEGDMQNYGVVYIGTGGRGIFSGRPVEPELNEDFGNADAQSSWTKYYDSYSGSGAEATDDNGYTIADGMMKNSWDGKFLNKRYCIYNGAEWKNNIRIRVSLNNEGGSAGNKAMVMFAVKDKDNYYAAYVDGGNNVSLYKYWNGNEVLLKTMNYADAGIRNGTLEISHIGSHITVSRIKNGAAEEVIAADDMSFSGGSVGIGTIHSVCKFDKIAVVPGCSELANAHYTLSGGKLNISCKAYVANDRARIYSAAYDSKGIMTAFVKNNELTLNKQFDFSTGIDADNISDVKLFMWDSEMMPVCKTVSAEKQ